MSILITFEGIEGAGKTTQIRYLESYLRKKGFEVLRTREPGGTPLGEKLRKILFDEKLNISPLSELLLILAQRAQHVEEIILPALKEKKIVLCDRFSDATLAYQGYGRGINLELINHLNTIATKGLMPHLTFLLDCDVKIGLKRKGVKNRFERENREFHEIVRKGYLEIASLYPERIKVLDGSKKKKVLRKETIRVSEEILSKYGIR